MSGLNWETVCNLTDINKNTGVCALVNGQQIAVFKVGNDSQLFALQNYDPFGEANVLSRGLIGDVGGQVVLASPLYKQQFVLESGKCLEDDSVTIKTYAVREQDGKVQVQA